MVLPEGFRFGVATAGFQIEGGFNGPGEPQNNWAGWEQAGRVEPSGIALDFWNRYEDQLDRAAALGSNAFRLSIEWARVEPEAGRIDETAWDNYEAILRACADRGLEPLVTLHHFTHPHWLGEAWWTDLEAPDRFAEWAGRVVDRLGRWCRSWVTINELNILAIQSYWTGDFPPGRWASSGDTVRAFDHLLTAHVLAYAEISRRQPGATVATNNFSSSVYELDRLLIDTLLARHRGVERHDLRSWLIERRRDWHAAVGPASARERALRRVAAATVPLDRALPRATAAVYASPHDLTLDVMQVDHYDPYMARQLRTPGRPTAGGRHWGPTQPLWEQPADPDTYARFVRLNHEPGLALGIVENGLCNRVRRGRSYSRDDGWTRPRYLREHLAATVGLIDAGLPIDSYFHWTLADNYEWGSYEPRFGLFGVDRERGGRWSDLDAMGEDAAGECRRLFQGLRAGDRSVLDPPATARHP